MPRAMWTGAISFGMVSVPVKLYSALNRKTVRFHQLSGKTGMRVAQKRIDSQTASAMVTCPGRSAPEMPDTADASRSRISGIASSGFATTSSDATLRDPLAATRPGLSCWRAYLCPW